MSQVKQEVREFYDQVGWQKIAERDYQNARYEDLRPVSKQYIHDCHLRVARHLRPSGRFLLDAGSGPIQYFEYIEYSRGYAHRVCVDLSITALCEARMRIGDHGLFVVADIANLPFPNQVFDGIVSLHTIHHLAENEQAQAYIELHRVLAEQRTAVVVNGWSHSALLAFFEPLIRTANRVRSWLDRGNRQDRFTGEISRNNQKPGNGRQFEDQSPPKGTHTRKHNYLWLEKHVAAQVPIEVFVWRSVSVRFLRALIHPRLGGRQILKILFALEERFPRFFGRYGKYPLILIHRQ